ncbi:MAG: ABC transporter ATP-binding protein [Pirellulales bacterium]|nr:ABC transporter ATP-binding protein [Pirellulales bacterium]
MIDSNTMIEFRGLFRHFGQTKAVDGVSFGVERGTVFGFIGPNGAGKTTSMRILATLDQPTAGDAFVDGFSVVEDPDRVRHRLGFMPDYTGTYPNVNVREYLDFFARAYHLRGAKRERAVEEVMDFTGLDVLADKPTDGLSKGMRQRLCLGRALIHDPTVLVLDEPAAGLDPRARIELREMIRDLAAKGKTVLISSHILTELSEVCDTVGIIEQGRLLAVGAVDAIQHPRHKARQAKKVMEIRLIGDTQAAAEWLAANAQIEKPQTDGQKISFLFDGDRQQQADLLRAMIMADFQVESFGSRRQSLEDVFMQVTEGLVQ